MTVFVITSKANHMNKDYTHNSAYKFNLCLNWLHILVPYMVCDTPSKQHKVVSIGV